MNKVIILIITAFLSVAAQADSIQQSENDIKTSEEIIAQSEKEAARLEKQLETLLDSKGGVDNFTDADFEKDFKIRTRQSAEQDKIIAETRKINEELRKKGVEQRAIIKQLSEIKSMLNSKTQE